MVGIPGIDVDTADKSTGGIGIQRIEACIRDCAAIRSRNIGNGIGILGNEHTSNGGCRPQSARVASSECLRSRGLGGELRG